MLARSLVALCPLALAAALGACGPKVVPSSILEEDDPRAGRAEAAAATPRAAPAEPARAAAPAPRPLAGPGGGARTGTIERAALLAVLDAGPGALLRTVELSPTFDGQRFVGWRIDQIVDRASPLARVDLAAGDVVVSVNRMPLARPEHVGAVWQALRTADAISAEVWRGDARLSLTFAIAPALTAPPSSTTTPAAPHATPTKP